MDSLSSIIKSTEDDFSLSAEMGIPWIFEGQVIRRDFKNHRTFWSIVIQKVRRAIKNEVKLLMLRACLAKHYFDPLVEDSPWAAGIVKAPDFIPIPGKGKVEGSRDPPPKIFIPIPKFIESNGCARSDLLLLAYF
jgi:hypothetical protein